MPGRQDSRLKTKVKPIGFPKELNIGHEFISDTTFLVGMPAILSPQPQTIVKEFEKTTLSEAQHFVNVSGIWQKTERQFLNICIYRVFFTKMKIFMRKVF